MLSKGAKWPSDLDSPLIASLGLGAARSVLPACVSHSASASRSTVTTAAAAAAATSAALLPRLLKQRRRHLSRSLVGRMTFRGCSASSSASTNSFRIEPVEGKGLGVIAERSIACGELIVAETPVLAFSSDDTAAYRQEQFDVLPRHQQDAVMGLHDNFAATNAKATLEGIIRTNSYSCDNGSFDVVVCPTISRFNHSCAPNCELSWDDELNEEHVYAATAIEPGEELCTYFVDVVAPAVDRQWDVWQHQGFECRCLLCSKAPDPVSDKRRSQLQQLEEQLVSEGADDPEQGLETIGDLLRLYDAEGIHLQSLRRQAFFTASQLLMMLDDVEGARRCAKQAYWCSVRCQGPDHAQTRNLIGLIRELQFR